MQKVITVVFAFMAGMNCFVSKAQKTDQHNGFDSDLGSTFKLSDARSRSISPENFVRDAGKGGIAELGNGTGSKAARKSRVWVLAMKAHTCSKNRVSALWSSGIGQNPNALFPGFSQKANLKRTRQSHQ